jgi:hypothetical protein
MSPREQSDAVKLLAETVAALERRVAQKPNPEDVKLVERARAFLALPLDAPQSHGSRRG